MLDDMITGCPTEIRAPIQRDVKYLYSLLSDVIDINQFLEIGSDLIGFNLEKYAQRRKPTFITNLFNHFVANVKKVEINLFSMNFADEYATRKQWGFKIFKPLLFDNSTQSTPNMALYTSLFCNCTTITLFNLQKVKNGYKSTIDLDDSFALAIFTTIQSLQKRKRKLSLKYIAITQPKGSIAEFINNHSEKFTALNWRLYQDSWNDPSWGECDVCLYIAPK